jgi:ABC-type uncharacterized transport system substrate-binding protein
MSFLWASAIGGRILLAVVVSRPAPGSVVVVTESGVPAYAEAVEGLTGSLGANLTRVVDLRAAGAASDLARSLEARETRVAVAVGVRALAELRARKTGVPVVAAMILRGPEIQGAGQINLDVPLGAQLSAVRALLPHALRVGLLRGPALAWIPPETLESQGRKEGYTVVVADCDGPVRLLKAVAWLKDKVDFLLCLPDPDLYNAVTIQPLVLAAIEDRLPIVGFSPGFVRAGAVAGVYPDYRAAGRQAGDMALRLQRGEASGGEEYPIRLRTAVNQRVMRLLGLDLRIPPGVEVFR